MKRITIKVKTGRLNRKSYTNLFRILTDRFAGILDYWMAEVIYKRCWVEMTFITKDKRFLMNILDDLGKLQLLNAINNKLIIELNWMSKSVRKTISN